MSYLDERGVQRAQRLHGALRRCRLQLPNLSGVFARGSSTGNLPTDKKQHERRGSRDRC